MTKEEINEAIARACGWTQIRECSYDDLMNSYGPLGDDTPLSGCVGLLVGINPEDSELLPIPDYCGDLNAMAEAEKWMQNNKGLHFSKAYYTTYLPDAAIGAEGSWAVVSATSEQRAKAFVRTFGLWDSEQ